MEQDQIISSLFNMLQKSNNEKINMQLTIDKLTAEIEAFKVCSTVATLETVEAPDIALLPAISTIAEEGAEPVLVIKLAAPSSRIPTSVIDAEADRAETALVSRTAELDTEPEAFSVELPVKVSPLNASESGNSLIAPKPSITTPYLEF